MVLLKELVQQRRDIGLLNKIEIFVNGDKIFEIMQKEEF